VLKALKVFKELKQEDISVLGAIERLMRKYEYVPVEMIAKEAKMDINDVEYYLSRLNKFELVRRWIGPYIGYVLNMHGYDCLALHALVCKDVISAIGRKLGVGKEADVFDALTPDGRRVVLKFHRIGRISFRSVRRVRVYVGDRRHTSWLYISRLSAKREFEALKILYPLGVAVPEPIAHNRHVVVISFIDGIELSEVKELSDPQGFLGEIIENLRIAYVDGGIVHADLNAYNIIVTDDEEMLIIDWPQWVSTIHPSAEMLLRRDLKNIFKFFRKRFGIEADEEEALKYIKGE